MPKVELPVEIWLRIFEDNSDILDRYDLSVITQTCKTFRDLAIKSLYRHIVWKNPVSLVHCLSFLRRIRGTGEGNLNLPTSLTIGVSRMSANGRSTIVGEDARILPAQGRRLDVTTLLERKDLTSFAVLESGETAYDFRISLFASPALYESMLDTAQLFVSLRELIFTNVALPDTIHTLLHCFPDLRKLHLETCVISPTIPDEDIDHTTLPITELTLRGLYHAIDVMHQPEDPVHLNPRALYYLAAAQTLEILHIDTTARIFTLFNRPKSPPVPPNLKRLFLHRPKPTKQDCRLTGTGPAQRRAQETAPLMLSMSLFLAGAPKIESISTCFPFSDAANFQMPLVPPNHFDTEHLREYSGPITSFNFPPLACARNLRAVHFIDDKTMFLLSARKFGNDFERLEVLSLYVTMSWDDEIVRAACSTFSNVSRIRIEYTGPGPTDNFIVSLGSQALAKMERLHTFQLFETNGKLPVITDEWIGDDWTTESMIKTLILPWNTYCPQLREVQLMDGYLWRRAHDKDLWAQRRFLPETDEGIWKTSVF